MENQAEYQLRGFLQSERRASRGWTELGQFPPGGLSRGGKTSAPDKSSWTGAWPLLEQGGLMKARAVFRPLELGV